ETELQKYSRYQDQLHYKASMYSSHFGEGEYRGRIEGRKEGRKEGIQEGLKKGRQEGMEKGMEKGMERSKLNTAKQMIKKGYAVDVIMDILGLSKEVIESLIVE
ncbi:MAG: hypothetical protein B6226_00840, partial [Candidatus Cloacimonetes bacterium 4572_65]